MSRLSKALARPFERVGDIDVPLTGKNFLVSNIAALAFLAVFLFALLYTILMVLAEKLHLVRRLQ
ncbi:MAG: hypothetical protein AAB726_03050 [Patescibacteria group bacterium]